MTKNFLEFYGVTQIFEGEKNLNALIESAHFDLETYLFRPGVLITNGFSSTFDKRNISLQLIEAIKYLHEIGMVHSMISTSEILVKIIDSTPKILLSSIGGFVHEDHMLERCPSGARYLSPEQFTEMKSTYHSDIYSLGMVLWSIFSGRHPFENCDLRMATLAIMNGEKNHIPVIDTVDPDIMSRRKVLSKTLNACWDLDPVKRPTIDRVLEVCEYLNEKDLVFWWTPTLVKKVLPTLPVKFYFKN